MPTCLQSLTHKSKRLKQVESSLSVQKLLADLSDMLEKQLTFMTHGFQLQMDKLSMLMIMVLQGERLASVMENSHTSELNIMMFKTTLLQQIIFKEKLKKM